MITRNRPIHRQSRFRVLSAFLALVFVIGSVRDAFAVGWPHVEFGRVHASAHQHADGAESHAAHGDPSHSSHSVADTRSDQDCGHGPDTAPCDCVGDCQSASTLPQAVRAAAAVALHCAHTQAVPVPHDARSAIGRLAYVHPFANGPPTTS
jgi:hypothetical protein